MLAVLAELSFRKRARMTNTYFIVNAKLASGFAGTVRIALVF